MDQTSYSVVKRIPSVEDYLHLRSVAGLTPFSREAAMKGLPNSVFAVQILHEGKAIGMGRLIGDGGCFFQVTDIAVHPDHQGRGLGKAIMAALMDYVGNELPASAYISLIADVPANRLYENFGFKETAPRSLGMAYRIDP
jgi:ribosomal protein S18 acetylase RimI-like enzyme